MSCPLDLEPERNHIRPSLSADEKFNSLLVLATGNIRTPALNQRQLSRISGALAHTAALAGTLGSLCLVALVEKSCGGRVDAKQAQRCSTSIKPENV